MTQLFTEYPPYFIIFCILAGLSVAALLYSRTAPWSASLNYTLAAMRAILVGLVTFLLLGPYLKATRPYLEPPVVVMAIDNSQSISLTADSLSIANLMQATSEAAIRLQEAGYEVQWQTLQTGTPPPAAPKDISFRQPGTNLSGMLRHVQGQYENRNLAAVVLLSDGIFNQGVSPLYEPLPFLVYTIGVGDTLPRTDVILRTVFANKIAYMGNRFPLVAELTHQGFAGRTVEVSLIQNGQLAETKQVVLGKDNALQTVEFLATSAQKGMQRFSVSVKPLSGEFTTQNNSRNVYIEILDAREKILIVAKSPHPDIKAIRSTLERNSNYEAELLILSLDRTGERRQEILRNKYDLVIMHQLPDYENAVLANDLYDRFANAGVPIWIICGSQTNLPVFNRINGVVALQSLGSQTDLAFPMYNRSFDRFLYEDSKKNLMNKFPPVQVPFGEVQLAGNAMAILQQRIGSVPTNRPMLAVGEVSGRKQAVLIGEGFWQWRLQEGAAGEPPAAFDELVGKLIQFLSAKDDKRKFRVYPTADDYVEADNILFETEIYNDIYEKIYGQKVELRLTDDDKKVYNYTYVNSVPGFRYQVSGLTQGIYQYTASTVLNGQQETSSGQFTIRSVDLEAINTQADFALLRNLSIRSGGTFFTPDQYEALTNTLAERKPADRIHSQEAFQDLIEFVLLLAALLLLATMEWGIRKFKGSY